MNTILAVQDDTLAVPVTMPAPAQAPPANTGALEEFRQSFQAMDQFEAALGQLIDLLS